MDLSDNPITEWGPLPTSLKELTLTGCKLNTMSPDILQLTALSKLSLGANRCAWATMVSLVFCAHHSQAIVPCRLSDAGPVFQLPALLHAGLSYNPISALPPHAVLAACTSIISLDLAHCDLEDLDGTLFSLSLMPRLQSLSLAGNPFCLHPSYQPTVQAQLGTKLAYLDGQRVETQASGAPSSRPSTSQGQYPPLVSMARQATEQGGQSTGRLSLAALLSAAQQASDQPSAAAVDKGGTPSQDGSGGGLGQEQQQVEQRVDTYLEVALRVQVLEDVFGAARARWAAEAETAQAAGTPPVFTGLEPPLQPVYYHVEVEGWVLSGNCMHQRLLCPQTAWVGHQGFASGGGAAHNVHTGDTMFCSCHNAGCTVVVDYYVWHPWFCCLFGCDAGVTGPACIVPRA